MKEESIVPVCFVATIIIAGLVFFGSGLAAQDVEFETKAEDGLYTSDANLAIDWKFETYSDITVTTDKRTVTISLLRIADCNDAEISRFADFMQLVTSTTLISFDPNVYEVLVDRLVSPKLITSDLNE